MEKLEKSYLDAWRLFITAHSKLIQQIDSDLTTAEQIPLHWYDVLIELYEAPQRRLRMHELAERVVLSRSGLTRLVDRLEQAQYILRETDPEDRRGFYAILTDTGLEAMQRAWPVYADGIQRYFANAMTDDDANRMIQVFTEMLKSVKRL